MIRMPDGNQIEMHWKSVSYLVKDKKLTFAIVPMCEGADIVCIPKRDKISDNQELKWYEELVFLTQAIDWKRQLVFLEVDIKPEILEINTSLNKIGSFEMTEGGKKIEEAYLFDPESPLTQEQVKELYIDLESRFAQGISGDVKIIKESYLEKSVMKEIILPILKENKEANVVFV